MGRDRSGLPSGMEPRNCDCSREYALLLRALAAGILTARLSTGARVLDATDCKKWLVELADQAEGAEGLEQFLSQICKLE